METTSETNDAVLLPVSHFDDAVAKVLDLLQEIGCCCDFKRQQELSQAAAQTLRDAMALKIPALQHPMSAHASAQLGHCSWSPVEALRFYTSGPHQDAIAPSKSQSDGPPSAVDVPHRIVEKPRMLMSLQVRDLANTPQ